MKISQITIFCLLISLLMPPTTFAQAVDFEQATENWSQQATQIAAWVEEEKWAQAKAQLEELAEQFSNTDLGDKELRVAEIQLLSSVILQLEKQLNHVSPDPTKTLDAAKRLRIAFDALSHPHQPLWQQFYQPLQQKIQHYKEILSSSSDQGAMQQEWTSIRHDFFLLWPGLVLGKSQMTVEKVDSLLKKIEKTSNLQQKREYVQLLANMLRPLFFGSEQEVIALVNPVQAISLQLMITILSCFILLILSYVSWKRYKQSHPPVYDTIKE